MHKPCTEQGCTTLAVFNEPGAGHGLYCGQHKPPGFINVKVRRAEGLGNGLPSHRLFSLRNTPKVALVCGYLLAYPWHPAANCKGWVIKQSLC